MQLKCKRIVDIAELNPSLILSLNCAQLAIRQFSGYSQTALAELLTESWCMTIDTLWLEKHCAGSAARIESLSFRACDLLQCLILVITKSLEL